MRESMHVVCAHMADGDLDALVLNNAAPDVLFTNLGGGQFRKMSSSFVSTLVTAVSSLDANAAALRSSTSGLARKRRHRLV